MRLKPFNPNKELKKLNRKYTKKHLIISLIVLVLIISIGSSYAIFSIQPEYHTFIKGTVGEFSTGDILLSVLVEGEKQDSFPAKDSGYAFESVTCENGTTGTWDNENWGLNITFTKPDKCTVNFKKNKLVNFMVGETTYQAKEGMSWGEWLESEYSNSNFMYLCLDPSLSIVYINVDYYYVKYNNININKNQIINNGDKYELIYFSSRPPACP